MWWGLFKKGTAVVRKAKSEQLCQFDVFGICCITYRSVKSIWLFTIRSNNRRIAAYKSDKAWLILFDRQGKSTVLIAFRASLNIRFLKVQFWVPFCLIYFLYFMFFVIHLVHIPSYADNNTLLTLQEKSQGELENNWKRQ